MQPFEMRVDPNNRAIQMADQVRFSGWNVSFVSQNDDMNLAYNE